MTGPFTVEIDIRSYELGVNGHLSHVAYHQYCEHARTAHLRNAGCSITDLTDGGLALVLLETRVRFIAELRAGDHVEVTSELAFAGGRTFTFIHRLRRADALLAADITAMAGLMDMGRRRLISAPEARLAEIADAPALLGIEHVRRPSRPPAVRTSAPRA